ncbi:MAG: MFS transporter [Microthrixaceae bacterium]
MVTVVAFESLAISTVMPIVERDLGELWLYGWVFAAFYIGTLIGAVIGGNVVDHVQPLGPMLVGIGLFVGGLFVGGLALNMEMLVAGRLLQGFGAGVVPAVSYVVVARGFPADLHPRVFAAMSSAWVIPSLISPLLASFIARHVSWRWVFLGLIPVTLVVTAVGAPRVAAVGRGSNGIEESGAQTRSVIARILILAMAAVGVITGLGMDRVALGIAVAAVGAVVLIVVFRRLTPEGTLGFRPRLPAAVMLRGVLTYAFFASDAYVSLAVTSVRGMTTTFAGFALVCSSGSWTVGSWVQARLMQNAGSGPVERRHRTSSLLVRSGGTLLAVGALGMSASLSSGVPVWVWLISSTTMGLGMGLAYTTISVVTLAEAEVGREGEATASLQMSEILGVAMGTGIAGAFVAIGDRMDASAVMMVLPIFLVSAVAALVVVGGSTQLGRPD